MSRGVSSSRRIARSTLSLVAPACSTPSDYDHWRPRSTEQLATTQRATEQLVSTVKFFRTLAAALAVALCLTRSLAADDERQRFLEHAPANSCLAVYSGDLSSTCAAFQDTRIGLKLCGDTFAPLVAELTKRDMASALRLRPMFGFDWSDVAETKAPGGLLDRKSTRLNSSHTDISRMPSSA